MDQTLFSLSLTSSILSIFDEKRLHWVPRFLFVLICIQIDFDTFELGWEWILQNPDPVPICGSNPPLKKIGSTMFLTTVIKLEIQVDLSIKIYLYSSNSKNPI